MQEVVESVKRVSDMISEITAAGQEQSTGVDQINNAIMQMDSVTQQNAALVEEAAAAAATMQEQSENLVKVVSVFKLDNSFSAPKPRPAARSSGPAKRAAPAPTARIKAQPAKATAEAGQDWEEF
jgi:methyl-accepting chemotaxis protein